MSSKSKTINNKTTATNPSSTNKVPNYTSEEIEAIINKNLENIESNNRSLQSSQSTNNATCTIHTTNTITAPTTAPTTIPTILPNTVQNTFSIPEDIQNYIPLQQNININLLNLGKKIHNTLYVGQVIKNYKELCLLLDLIPTTGKSRQYQIQDIDKFISYERKGQKYIITNIYDKPIQNNKTNIGIFTKCIEIILLYYMNETYEYNQGDLIISKNSLWRSLGMINHNYGISSSKILELISDEVKANKLTEKDQEIITNEMINSFYNKSNSRLSQIMIRALNSLKGRSVIEWNDSYFRVDSNNHITREATVTEIQQINEMQRKVLSEKFGYEMIREVFFHNRQKEFYDHVNENLLDKYGWTGYCKRIHVIYSREAGYYALADITKQLYKSGIATMNVNIIDQLTNEFIQTYENTKRDINDYNNKREDWESNMVANAMIECANHPEKYNDLNEALTYIFKEHPFNYGKYVWFGIPNTYVIAQQILINELIKINESNDINIDDADSNSKSISESIMQNIILNNNFNKDDDYDEIDFNDGNDL